MGAGLWACPWEGRRLAGGRQVLEDYSVEGWAADDYDACERRADRRQVLGQLSSGEPVILRSEARPGGPGNRFAWYFHGFSYRGSGWLPVDRFTQLPCVYGGEG